MNTMHSKRCLAEAIISAVQNIRDNQSIDDLAFRLAAQANEFLPEADDYLNTGLQTCTCGAWEEDQVVEMFKTDPSGAQATATVWLRDNRISPESYMRIARRTRAIDEDNAPRFRLSPERRAAIIAAVEDEHSHGGTPTLDDGCGK
jgi:hypothetical protein